MTRKLNDEGQESILQEAHRLTHGERNVAYAHPYDDYACTAALFTALLGDQLRSPITAHQMALAMCCVKLSRESRVPKRDNLVDLAGYAWVARMCVEESELRNCGCNAVVSCPKHSAPVELTPVEVAQVRHEAGIPAQCERTAGCWLPAGHAGHCD